MELKKIKIKCLPGELFGRKLNSRITEKIMVSTFFGYQKD